MGWNGSYFVRILQNAWNSLLVESVVALRFCFVHSARWAEKHDLLTLTHLRCSARMFFSFDSGEVMNFGKHFASVSYINAREVLTYDTVDRWSVKINFVPTIWELHKIQKFWNVQIFLLRTVKCLIWMYARRLHAFNKTFLCKKIKEKIRQLYKSYTYIFICINTWY